MGVCALTGVCTKAHHLYSASFCCTAFAGPRTALKSFQVHCRPEQQTLEHLSHSEQLSHASPRLGLSSCRAQCLVNHQKEKPSPKPSPGHPATGHKDTAESLPGSLQSTNFPREK